MPWCPNGHDNPAGSAFCSTCGSPIQPPAPPAYYGPPGPYPPPGPYLPPGSYPPPGVPAPRSSARVYGLIGAAVAVVVVAIGVFVYLNSGDSNDGKPYPANIQTNFLNACEVQGSVSQCGCALQYIEARIPLAEFETAEADIKAGRSTPDWVYEAIAACA